MNEIILRQLKDFIISNYMIEEDDVKWNESLVDQGIIDSIGLIEIVTFLESTYDIKIVNSDIKRENFGSVILMVDYVESLLKKKNESVESL
jgi:acyl carrier protein